MCRPRCRELESGLNSHQKMEVNHIVNYNNDKRKRYCTICAKKITLLNYRINLVLFLYKPRNFIYILLISFLHKKYIVFIVKVFLKSHKIIFGTCDRHSDETVTPRKNVAEHEHMRKWMIEFQIKFESRSIKFVRVINSSICFNLFPAFSN